MTKLWLDDLRKPSDYTWTWVLTVTDAKAVFTSGPVDHASLDHDLGGRPAELGGVYDWLEPTGMELAEWMVAEKVWPRRSLRIHSINKWMAPKMLELLAGAAPVGVEVVWTPEERQR